MSSKVGVPRPFFWKRMHSLMGLWLVLFLIEHLLTNSQTALWLGNDKGDFIRAVNALHELPYLHIIEISLLGVPFLIHIVWGICYLFTAQPNSFPSDGTTSSLPEYPRNHTYTWQRVTSWILIAGVLAHVVHMRFIDYPILVQEDGHTYYAVPLNSDENARKLATRFDLQFKEHFEENKIIAIVSDFGTAELLVVGNAFKTLTMALLYTFFVLAAVFHAFNGVWTAAISWGVTLTDRSQKLIGNITVFLMVLFGFLGLAAIWGTYLVT